MKTPLLLIPAITLAACSTEIASPRPEPLIAVSARRSALRHANSNSVKYRDTGKQPGRASSGSAALEIRALVDKNGNALVEATTGSFDAGTAPGSINKVQVKIEGGEAATLNYRNVGGYWSHPYQGLMTGDAIQLQGNVSGIDGEQTDVVTVSSTVANRPDLAVLSLAAPKHLYTHNSVILVTSVRELNGEIGARANCVLSIDGTVVDQATGIWVDAGDIVSCMFMRRFDVPGTHNVTVSATGVNPGDWDDANNARSASIEIADPGTPVANGYVEYLELISHEDHRDVRGGEFPRDFHTTVDYDLSQLFMLSESPDEAPGPFQRVNVQLFRNNVAIDGGDFEVIPTDHSELGSLVSDCGFWQSGRNGGSYCTQVNTFGGGGHVSFFHAHFTGRIVYYAREAFCELYGDCDAWNFAFTDEYGSTPYGFLPNDDLRVELSYFDANGAAHSVNETLRMEDMPDWANFSISRCFPWYDGLGEACRTVIGTGSAVFASKEWSY